METQRFRKGICSLFGCLAIAFASASAGAAATDFSQTSIGLNIGSLNGLNGVVLRSMTDPRASVQDSMFYFQPIFGGRDSIAFPGTMTRRNSLIDTLTQTQVALIDFETFQPTFWFPLWTFGNSMGVFRPQTMTEANYSFDSLPLAEFDAAYGTLLWPIDFDSASPPVQFGAGPGDPLENFSPGFAEFLIPRFVASAPFPKTSDSPGLMFVGYLEDNTNPAVPVTFGARSDSGTLAPIDVMTFPGILSDTSPNAATIALGDFDGDGNTDRALLVQADSSDSSRQLVLSKGNGDGSFQAPVVKAIDPKRFALDLAAVDFDGDGAQDLVVSYLSTDATTTPPGPGLVEAISDVFGAFNVQAIAMPSSAQFPTWVEAMDCDKDGDRDDLVIVTNRFPADSQDFAIRASDVVCYLQGNPANSVIVYPEAAFNLPAELADLPYLSLVANSAVGTLGCGDAWAGTAAFLVASGVEVTPQVKLGQPGGPLAIALDSVFAQHSDCSTPPPPPGPPPLVQGSGCALAPKAEVLGLWAWLPALSLVFLGLRRERLARRSR